MLKRLIHPPLVNNPKTKPSSTQNPGRITSTCRRATGTEL